MSIKKNLITKVLITALALGTIGCSNKPTIEKIKDMTGDGILDILLKITGGVDNGTWLFIGKEDGTHLRSRLYPAFNSNSNANYFETEDKQAYFFDKDSGFYKQSSEIE